MRFRVLAITAAALSVGAAAVADELTTRELRVIGEGRSLFLQNCAACHGADARGSTVGTPAPNLRLIAERDGKFDLSHVMYYIKVGSGKPLLIARDEGSMPSWERTWRSQRPWNAMKLTHYLEFIQEEGR